jgi:hypothetical protein
MSALKTALQQIKPEDEDDDGGTGPGGAREGSDQKLLRTKGEREKSSATYIEYIQKQYPGYEKALKDFL